MSGEREYELLIDIAKLLRKHGPDAFDDLANKISTPEFSAQLATVLTAAASSGRSLKSEGKRGSHGKGTRRDLTAQLAALAETEPDKAAMLREFYDGLMAKYLLPTLREVRAFASDNGLPVPTATARPQVAASLLLSLVPLPLTEVQAKLNTLPPKADADDRSLQRWNDLILDKNR